MLGAVELLLARFDERCSNGAAACREKAVLDPRSKTRSPSGAPAVDLALEVAGVDLGHAIAVRVANGHRRRIAPPMSSAISPFSNAGLAACRDEARHIAADRPTGQLGAVGPSMRVHEAVAAEPKISSLRLSPSRSANAGEDSPSPVGAVPGPSRRRADRAREAGEQVGVAMQVGARAGPRRSSPEAPARAWSPQP